MTRFHTFFTCPYCSLELLLYLTALYSFSFQFSLFMPSLFSFSFFLYYAKSIKDTYYKILKLEEDSLFNESDKSSFSCGSIHSSSSFSFSFPYFSLSYPHCIMLFWLSYRYSLCLLGPYTNVKSHSRC
jgi:hypothetical protein